MSEEINIASQLKFASQHLFNLIVFIGILYYFLKDIVVSFFSNRSKKISREIQEANKVIEASQEAYNSSSQKINLIDSELTELRNSIDLITSRKTNDIIDNANLVANKIKNDTHDIIQLESLKLQSEVENSILNKAIEVAQDEIATEVTNDKDSELIISFLSEVKQNAVSNS
ncbi:ATP synthase F0 subunit B [bacterium]|nr:ATP synthase F0 subunit B [bacterium]